MDAKQVEVIQTRIVAMLRELQERRTDVETMYMVGVLAGRILIDAKQPRWAQMKRRLSPSAYDQTLLTAQMHRDELFAEGNKSAAFALELIITSVVGSRFDNKVINEGVALIDDTIEAALTAWRKSNAPAAPN